MAGSNLFGSWALHAALVRESGAAHSEHSDNVIVETLKQLSELMVHGDKHSDRFFEFFGEKSTMQLFVSVYNSRSFAVRVQVIQTVSILLINIRNQRSLFYLLSNNHINELMAAGVPSDSDDSEELLAYFVSFMKTLSLSVNADTIHFFFTASPTAPPVFPLYTQAVRLFHHPDHMVRTSVRTITLNVFQVRDPYARAFLLQGEGGAYPGRIASQVRALLLHMHAITSALMGMTVDAGQRHAAGVHAVEATARNMRADLEDLVREIGDTLFYVQDILAICAREEAEDAAAGGDAQFKLSKRGVPGLEDVDPRARLTHVADSLVSQLQMQVYEPIVLHTLRALAAVTSGVPPRSDGDASVDVHTSLLIDPALAVHMLTNSLRVLTYAPMRAWLFAAVFSSMPGLPLSDWLSHYSVHIPAAPPGRLPLIAPSSAPPSPVHVGAGKDEAAATLPRVALGESCIVDVLLLSVLCDDARLACLSTLALAVITKYAGTDARLCEHAAHRGLLPRAVDDVYFPLTADDAATPPRDSSPPILRLDSPPRARAATVQTPAMPVPLVPVAALSPPRRASVGGMRSSVSVNGIASADPRSQPLRRASTTGADTLADGTPLCDGGIRSWRASVTDGTLLQRTSRPASPSIRNSAQTVTRSHMTAVRDRVCTILLVSLLRVPCIATLNASLHLHLLCELAVPPIASTTTSSATRPWLQPYHMQLLQRGIAWLGAHIHATIQSSRAADVPNALAPFVNLIEAYADSELRTSPIMPAVLSALLPGYARVAGEVTATPTVAPPLSSSPAAPAYDLRSPPSSHALSMNIRSRARACVDGIMASRVDLSHTCESVHTLQPTHGLTRVCGLTLAAMTAAGDWDAWVRACGHSATGDACALPRDAQPFILQDAGAAAHQAVQILIWLRVLHACARSGGLAFTPVLRAADILPLPIVARDAAADAAAWTLPRPTEADVWDGFSVSPDLLLRRIAPPLDSIRVGNVFPVTRLPWFMATQVPVSLDIATPCIGRSAAAAVSEDPLKPLSSSLRGATRLGIVLGQSYLVLAEPVASKGSVQRVRALCVAPLQYTHPHTPSKTPHILDLRVLSREPVPLTQPLPLAPTALRVAADMSVKEQSEHAGEATSVKDALAWPIPLQLGVRGFTLLMDSADLSSHTCMHIDAARRRIMDGRLTALDVLCGVTQEPALQGETAEPATPATAARAADTMASATANAVSEAAKMTGGDASSYAAGAALSTPPAVSRQTSFSASGAPTPVAGAEQLPE